MLNATFLVRCRLRRHKICCFPFSRKLLKLATSKICHNVALDRLHNGNDVICYFWSTAVCINVSILGHVRVNYFSIRIQPISKSLQFWKRRFERFFIICCVSRYTFLNLTQKIGLWWICRRLRIACMADFVFLGILLTLATHKFTSWLPLSVSIHCPEMTLSPASSRLQIGLTWPPPPSTSPSQNLYL